MVFPWCVKEPKNYLGWITWISLQLWSTYIFQLVGEKFGGLVETDLDTKESHNSGYIVGETRKIPKEIEIAIEEVLHSMHVWVWLEKSTLLHKKELVGYELTQLEGNEYLYATGNGPTWVCLFRQKGYYQL